MGEKITFGKAMERLEEITSKLESGDLELEKALDQFEEGVKLIKYCQEKLTQAGARVEKLVESIEGTLTSELLETPAGEEEE